MSCKCGNPNCDGTVCQCDNCSCETKVSETITLPPSSVRTFDEILKAKEEAKRKEPVEHPSVDNTKSVKI